MEISSSTEFNQLPDILTPEQVAAYLGLHVRTIRAYIHDGKLRAALCGNRYLIRRVWIGDFLNKMSR